MCLKIVELCLKIVVMTQMRLILTVLFVLGFSNSFWGGGGLDGIS